MITIDDLYVMSNRRVIYRLQHLKMRIINHIFQTMKKFRVALNMTFGKIETSEPQSEPATAEVVVLDGNNFHVAWVHINDGGSASF